VPLVVRSYVVTYEGGVVVVAAVAGSTAAGEAVATRLSAMFEPGVVNAGLWCVPDSRTEVAVAVGKRNQVAAAGGLAEAGSCRSSAGVVWSNVSYDRQRLAEEPSSG
jgi:hypothetical protein